MSQVQVNRTITTNSPPPPGLHIPPSKHTVSVSIINTTGTIHGAKTSDFFGPSIKGHEWLAAPVFSFLIQHYEYDDNDPQKPIPGKTRNLLFDLGIRKDWWNSAPLLVDGLRSIDPPWTLTTERGFWDILGQAAVERSVGERDEYAAEEHPERSGNGPDFRDAESGRDCHAQSETAIAHDSAPNRCDIDPKTIEAIIWSHHHFDHTGDPSSFPSNTALIIGPGVKDALLPGYPDNPGSTLLKSDYERREVIELEFETGGMSPSFSDEEPNGPSGREERRKFKTLTIGQLTAIDYFYDGSFYLLDTPGHAVGHICALARVTSSLSETGGEMSKPDNTDAEIQDTFVLLAGDAFHHPGEIRPSRWMTVPERLSVTVAATMGEGVGRGIEVKDDHHIDSGASHRQGKSGDRFGRRRSKSASPIQSQCQSRVASGLDSDSISESESAPLVGMDIEDTSPSGIGIGTQGDITGPDSVGGGWVVGDLPVSSACAGRREPILRSQAKDGHMQHQYGPRVVEDGNIMMSMMDGPTQPGGDGSVHRPLEPNTNQATKTNSYSRRPGLGITDRMGGKAASTSDQMCQEVLTARGKKFTIPGKLFTALLPQFDIHEAGRGSDGNGMCGNGSFYYPVGSPLCQGPSRHQWHHNPSQAAATLHKLQEFDAQRNILVLAAHDESLLDLGSSMWFPRGTLDNWFKEGLKDKFHWSFLADFMDAIPLDGANMCGAEVCDTEKRKKRAPESTKRGKWGEGDSIEPTAFGGVTTLAAQHSLVLLRRWWETNKEHWGPVGRDGV